MKVLFFLLLFVAGAFARSAVQQQDVNAEGPACPIEDPLIREGPVPLNISVNPIVEFLEGSQLTDLIADGLSTLRYNVDIIAVLLTATFNVTIPSASGNATFSIAGGYIDARPFLETTIPSGNVTGGGLGKVSTTGVSLRGSATLFINIIGSKVQVATLNVIEAKFDSLSCDFDQLKIDGKMFDWAALSATIKQNFDAEFAASKGDIVEKIRVAANGIVGKYTLAELIDLIGPH